MAMLHHLKPSYCTGGTPEVRCRWAPETPAVIPFLRSGVRQRSWG